MYKIEIDYNKIFEEIDKRLAKKDELLICIQLPDGLKPKAKEIVEKIEKRYGKKVTVFIWAGSAFGACDIPWYIEDLGFDLLIHIGHSKLIK